MTMVLRATVLTDVSDRQARLVGAVGFNFGSSGADAVSNDGFTFPADEGGTNRGLVVAPSLFNGSTWDRIRSVRGGDPGRSLAIGDQLHAAVYGADLWTENIPEISPAAVSNAVVFRINNAAASGIRAVVERIEWLSNAARLARLGYFTTAQGNRTTVTVPGSNNAQGGAPVATFSRANNVTPDPATSEDLLGGVRLQANVPYVFRMPIVLPVDSSLDMWFAVSGALTTDTDTLTVSWYEEAT